MTTVFLDGAEVEFEETEGGATVGELVEEISKELDKLGRVVTEVSVDGAQVTHHAGGGELAAGLSTIEEVSVMSASREQVARAGLEVVRGYADFLEKTISECVGGIRLGEDMEGKSLSAVIEGVGEVARTLEALSKSPVAGGVRFFKENPVECYKGLVGCLEAVAGARASGDAITIADVLEYELAPLIMDISEKLEGAGHA